MRTLAVFGTNFWNQFKELFISIQYNQNNQLHGTFPITWQCLICANICCILLKTRFNWNYLGGGKVKLWPGTCPTWLRPRFDGVRGGWYPVLLLSCGHVCVHTAFRDSTHTWIYCAQTYCWTDTLLHKDVGRIFFRGGPIRTSPVLTTKNGRIFEIREV